MTVQELVAIWGAATGTVALGWNIFRHARSGPRLKITVREGWSSPPVAGVQAGGASATLDIEVVNRGTRDTQLTGIVAWSHSVWRARLAGKWFVNSSDLVRPIREYGFPKVLQPYEPWSASIHLSKALIDAARNHHLFVGFSHSAANRPALAPVKLRDRET